MTSKIPLIKWGDHTGYILPDSVLRELADIAERDGIEAATKWLNEFLGVEETQHEQA